MNLWPRDCPSTSSLGRRISAAGQSLVKLAVAPVPLQELFFRNLNALDVADSWGVKIGAVGRASNKR